MSPSPVRRQHRIWSRYPKKKNTTDISALLFTVTGPVARFARQIAGQGYICAAPSSYHEFTGPEPLKYDAEDTDKGNAWKIGKVCYSLNPYTGP
jgi:hypothetical protein